MSNLSELGDDYREWGKVKKLKKASNLVKSIEILNDHGIEFKQFSETHLRVGNYDYWPSTGLFIHIINKKKGRGVFNLINKIKDQPK